MITTKKLSYVHVYSSLKIHGECGTIDMKDLCWIPQLKNLEEFTISLVNPPKNGQMTFFDAGYDGRNLNVYFENPMTKLKSFKMIKCIGGFDDPVFLMRLKRTFPSLETFVYEG